MAISLALTDIDKILGIPSDDEKDQAGGDSASTSSPTAAPMPKPLVPPINQTPEMEAPKIGSDQALADANANSLIPKIGDMTEPQKPTKAESIAAGKSEFAEGMPKITAMPGTPEHGEQKQEVLEYQQAHPWGSDVSAQPGIGGKIGHVAAKIGNIAGDIFAPSTMALIPGTQLNNEMQSNANQREIAQGTENELKGAQTQQAESEAVKNLRPPPTGITPEETFMQDALHGGPNGTPKKDASGIPYNYLSAHGAWKAQEQEVKPPTNEQDLVTYAQLRNLPTRTPAQDKQLQDLQTRYSVGDKAATAKNTQIANELKSAPGTKKVDTQAYTVLPTDTDAEATAKLNAAKDLVSSANTQQAAGQRTTQQGDTQLNNSYNRQSAALEKAAAPVRAQAKTLGDTMEMVKGNTAFSDALVPAKTLTALVSGAGTGVRVTQAEINQILHGRSTYGDFEAIYQKWTNGESITPDQRQQITDVLGKVQEKVNARVAIIEDAEDKLDSANTVADQRAAVRQANAALDALNKQTGHSFTLNGKQYQNVPDDVYNKYKGQPGFKE